MDIVNTRGNAKWSLEKKRVGLLVSPNLKQHVCDSGVHGSFVQIVWVVAASLFQDSFHTIR